MRCDEIGVALTSVPSLPNRGPWGLKSELEPSRRLGLADTVAAQACIDAASLTASSKASKGRRRMSNTSNHPAWTADDDRIGHRGASHRSSSAGPSQSAFRSTSHVGRERSGVSGEPVAKKDGVDPTEVTASVFQNLFTGNLSRNDQSRITEDFFRAVFGGDA